MFVGYKDFLKDIFKYTLSLYSEMIGLEFAAFMTTLTKDMSQIAAHTSLVNIAYFIYNLGLGFSNIARTRINYLLGKGHGQAAKNFFIVCFIGMVSISMVLGGTIYLFKQSIVNFYTSNNESTAKYLLSLL